MRIFIALLLACVLAFLACSATAPTTKLRVLTEENPPYNYTDEKGAVVGQSTEVVRAIMNKLGQNINIEIVPWEQAYELLQKESGVALYSTARLPERENMFLWVGPIGRTEKYLYAKRGSGIKINSLADIKNVKAIVGVKNEAGVQNLIDQGGKFIYTTTIPEGLEKLMDGSADLWLGPKSGILLAAKKAGINPDAIEPVFLVNKSDLYIAFNKNTSSAIVQQWQQALDSLKK